jgi:hypothetical protein
MASWGADHLALSRIHHDDILRQAREAHFLDLAATRRQSRPSRFYVFLAARRPGRSARPALADLLTTRA